MARSLEKSEKTEPSPKFGYSIRRKEAGERRKSVD
jgi:hypothetical protein